MNSAHFSRDLVALTVLAVLAERPRHPYEIQRVIHHRHKDFAIGRPRALYHAVDQLVRSGAIEAIETSREGKRPERTVYRVTEEGREDLASCLRDLIENPVVEYPVFTAAVSFLGYLPAAEVIEALQARVVLIESQVGALDAALRALRDSMKLPRLFVIEHEFTRALRQAELSWVKALLADLESGQLTWDNDLVRGE